MKLTKNADLDKYGYCGYVIGFDSRSQFSLLGGEWGKNVVSFGVSNSLSVHADIRKKDILDLGEGPTDVLNDTTIKI